MIDTKGAHEILGVSKDASKIDIEKKYFILLKKYKMSTSSKEKGSAEQVNFEELTKAYNTLMGYDEPKTEESFKKPNPLMLKLGIDEKKASNFLYYYKIHIIIGIIVLITLVFTVKGCVNRVEPDFTTAFIGQISFMENEDLKLRIKAAVPEIKEPGFDGAYIGGGEGGGEQEYAMQMKAMVLFAAQSVDFFILDKENFKRYAQQGAFANLDDIAVNLGVDKNKNKDYSLKANDDTGEHLYGIDISNSKVLKDSGIIGKEMIAAFSINGKQQDKSIKLLEFLLN